MKKYIVLIIIIIVIVYIKFFSVIKNIKPTDTKFINNECFVLKVNNFNVYGVVITNDIILIDSGNDPIKLLNELKRLSIETNNIKAFFLTHSDYDHVGGITALNNCKIYFPKKEIPYIDGTKKRKIYYGLKVIRNKLEVNIINLLEENEIVKIGNIEIKAISTPGHTSGSMSYLVNNKYLFVGDLLLISGNKIYPMIKLYSENIKQTKESIKSIFKLKNIELLGTTHSGFITNLNNISINF